MKYTFDSRVRYSEIDEDGRLSVTGLIDYFQDTATFQSEDYGIGLEYMAPMHLAWILSSWQIIIDRMPVLNEKIASTTWAYGFDKFYGYRNFTLTGKDGGVCARANSVWVMMDMKRQRPARVDELMLERYGTEAPLDMVYAPRKIELPGGGESKESFVITPSHLDTNHHVNNGKYVELAMGYLPPDLTIRQLRVEYKKQAHLGDVITPVVVLENGLWTVLLEGNDKAVYCIAEFETKEDGKTNAEIR